MVKCGVFFAVRTEFVNNIYTSFGFKGLITRGTVELRCLLLGIQWDEDDAEREISRPLNPPFCAHKNCHKGQTWVIH
jgi:hypothetical protein